jgi:cob(I)alamin adenosyltransferase
MFYTKKGDDGTSGLWGTGKRLPKHHIIFEALGSLDELNSFLGICKVTAEKKGIALQKSKPFSGILKNIQYHLFTIQAELAGTDKKMKEKSVQELEALIATIEQQLPPIKTFLLSGGTELSPLLDYARTLARRAERRVLAAASKKTISKHTHAYLNRLSTLLYALARLANEKQGVREQPPTYR